MGFVTGFQTVDVLTSTLSDHTDGVLVKALICRQHAFKFKVGNVTIPTRIVEQQRVMETSLPLGALRQFNVYIGFVDQFNRPAAPTMTRFSVARCNRPEQSNKNFRGLVFGTPLLICNQRGVCDVRPEIWENVYAQLPLVSSSGFTKSLHQAHVLSCQECIQYRHPCPPDRKCDWKCSECQNRFCADWWDIVTKYETRSSVRA